MKIQKRLARIAGILLSVGAFFITAVFMVESLYMAKITDNAKENIDTENQRNMMEDVKALSGEVTLFLSFYEDEVDAAMRNAALVLQNQGIYGKIDAENMEQIKNATGMSDLYLFDRKGDTILSTVEEAEGFNLYTVWDGYRMLVTGEAAELPSSIKIQEETGEIYKFTALPSYDSSGRITGIVQSALNASEIESAMQELVDENPMLTGLYLFEEQGLTLLSCAKKQAGVLSERGNVYRDEIVQAAFGGAEMLTREEESTLYCYLPMQRNGSTAYVLMLEIDQAYYLQNTAFVAATLQRVTHASNRAIIVLTLVFTAFSLLIIAALTGYVKKHVVAPIESLCEAAHEIALGKSWVVNDGHDVDAPRSNELGLLYATFSEVADGMQEQSKVIGEVSKGDFSVFLDPRSEYDEVALAINRMTELLSATISRIIHSAALIMSGSKQVADSAQTLSQGTMEQSEAVEELSTLMGELTQKAADNAEGAKTVHQYAEQAADDLHNSGEQMEDMVCAMERISQNGAKIIQMAQAIDDIASQTNLLALNASIESARAGSAGKGFSIVAGEVKSLAVKSTEMAATISELVQNTVTSIADGERIAGETKRAIAVTADGAAAMRKVAGAIARGCEEQREVEARARESVERISAVVLRISATAQEEAASSEELSGQAALLNELTGQFQLKVREK